jgi:PIN domain nuclease of toxin-antitoxin system
MDYLLDTHVVLWLAGNRKKIRKQTIRLLENPSHSIWISSASIWEIGVKSELGKLTIPDNWLDQIEDWDAKELAISWSHATRASELPKIHGDPFDRMLIAQALTERMTLVTDDEKIHQYDLKYIEP